VTHSGRVPIRFPRTVANGTGSGRVSNANVTTVGKAKVASTEFSSTIAVRALQEWNRANLRAIVFVQERYSRHVLTAAAIPFPAV
jgi:hypothetical protein